jgi:predicted O-methyltransferase YrrM
LGATPISAVVGAALAMFARMLDAKAVVEVGGGAGVSGLWLLRGMRADGVLTTIDAEPEHLRHAKETFRANGIAPGRTRLINGRAFDVLPRLADGTYDLVFIDGSPTDHGYYVRQAVPLLRPGGLIALHNTGWNSALGDSMSLATAALADDDSLLQVHLPLGDGLLCAARM